MTTQRAITEVENTAPLAAAECDHRYLSIRSYQTSIFDDHATSTGYCPTCQQWLCVTDHPHGRMESRPLTERELERIREYEDRYRHAAWLDELEEHT